MIKSKRQPRRYTQLSNASVKAICCAVSNFNSVYGDYKIETSLILISNAWELLAKAVLVKRKKNIYSDAKKTRTIPCEEAINKLLHWKEIEKDQAELLQQIVSLRNQCTHDTLPEVPEEIQHHLLFFACKFFRELSMKHFPQTEKTLTKNFVTLSFAEMTTYSDKVQKMVSKLRRSSKNDLQLVWLLERGLQYIDKNTYISQDQFEKLYSDKKKISPYLKIGTHLENADMIRIVPVQAPKNYSADIILRKGSKKLQESLPVSIKKTNFDEDYPYLTSDLAAKIGKSVNFTAKLLAVSNCRGNKEFHQEVRTSASQAGGVQRYSQTALLRLKKILTQNPDINPYKVKLLG